MRSTTKASLVAVLLAAVACAAVAEGAASDSLTFAGKITTPDSLSASFVGVRVVLNNALTGERLSSLVKHNGGFTFYDVPVGVYTLEVISSEFWHDPERLEVRPGQKLKCKFWDEGRSLLKLVLSERRAYFQVRPGWNWSSIFKNPLIIMVGFTALMGFGMPKLMASMDPESVKEMQRGQDVVAPDGRTMPPEHLFPRWESPDFRRLKGAQ
eukprot:TRINITY_DN4321_c0_g1_i1.p1 TRINITY_DN4321_c0_g1~~TRINITY_DN4321_c0_g1_i1.p1  ORF type:complete len:211 (+),score=57.46 TRINITY_DN4321_c0_g1_i1:3-635(+)